MFGTTMLTLVGTLNVSQGLLVGFASGGIGFDRNDVAFTSATTWAAATVTLGVLLGVTGFALRARKSSARAAAVSIVALHAISQLAMLRAYPAWSLLMITLDVIILFILTVPRGRAAEADAEPDETPIASVTKLALRRNSRSDRYRGRHKAGRPIVRHEDDDVILVDIVEELEPAVSATVDVDVDDIDFDSPTSWVRAVGHATVPMILGEPVEESLVPIQRASLDPLMDPLPVLIAAQADTAIIEGVMVEDEEELAAIGARPYVTQ
ncbi:hypothetical protein OHA72_03330 [Dactylosporangium sp. NBC_01737]|uniref:DUF7144 family membrane protein n=1 Tax=Dactylosporangium sp. NBC_01737 TaxID=2975959 RepID=UPI002E0DFC1C|nr:hypothetical protein OHA72_03330 [Dactylosporangium sp. NBC_01737]